MKNVFITLGFIGVMTLAIRKLFSTPPMQDYEQPVTHPSTYTHNEENRRKMKAAKPYQDVE